MRFLFLLLLALAFSGSGSARLIPQVCGSYRDRWKEDLHFHKHAARNADATPRATRPDIGNVAILEDSDGVVARRNEFNLDQKTLAFFPATAAPVKYRFQTSAGSYDLAAAASGSLLQGIRDDDARLVPLPFPFPFFGAVHREVFVNSDGNLTFGASDTDSSPRSLGRLASGPPRIAALFDDLDPSQARDGIRVLSDPNRFVVTWVQVPEYQDFGFGIPQTFQVRLYPDGRVEISYSGINAESAVVGIAPGRLQGSSTVVSFATGSSDAYGAAVGERFGTNTEVDLATAAQKFYESHDDSYDYLVFYNNLDIQADIGAIAFESTVRNTRKGYGDRITDTGLEYASPSRLQAVLNLGPLSQYPADPSALMRGQSPGGLTALSVLAHESGHLFLSYASVRDFSNPDLRPMLGRQDAHWSIIFNSEASFMEGARLLDNGATAPSRFSTVATYEALAPLDQYLMGFRATEEVPPTFVATGASASLQRRAPQIGIEFNGGRRDLVAADIVLAEGRRIPDHTVAQRRFRFAIILVVRQGTTPSQLEIDKLEAIRSAFDAYYRKSASDRAYADTSLKRSVRLSVFPAAGVIEGRSAQATVSIQKPLAAALTLLLKTQTGAASVPPSVTIPAGALSASFAIAGSRVGVEELSAEPADEQFATAYARIQVAAAAALRLITVSGDRQPATPGAPLAKPIVIRVTDINELPYSGVAVQASVSAGGGLTPLNAISDANGEVSFIWTPGADAVNRLTAQAVPGVAPVVVTATARPFTTAASVVNAASSAAGLSPGGLASVYGTNLAGGASAQAAFPWPSSLAGVTVLVGGRAASLLFVTDGQINFLVPSELPEGSTQLTITTPAGTAAPVTVPVQAVSPGVFFDAASKFGAILNAGTAQTTEQRPAASGEFIEIYATGLGPVRTTSAGFRETVSTPQVQIGTLPAKVLFSGLAPGYLGLFQINVQMPEGVPRGVQPLRLVVNGLRSNEVITGVR